MTLRSKTHSPFSEQVMPTHSSLFEHASLAKSIDLSFWPGMLTILLITTSMLSCRHFARSLMSVYSGSSLAPGHWRTSSSRSTEVGALVARHLSDCGTLLANSGAVVGRFGGAGSMVVGEGDVVLNNLVNGAVGSGRFGFG